MSQVILKPGRDKPVRQRHPWIFSGAVARVQGDAADGDAVDVVAADGTWLARGTLNRKSQIVVRLLTWRQDEEINTAFWRSRLERAIAGRAALASSGDTTAYRLVNAESDGLPGLIVDRYCDYSVTQFLTLGIERCKSQIVELLTEVGPLNGQAQSATSLRPAKASTPSAGAPLKAGTSRVRGVYERSDVEVRAKEGLPQTTGVLAGEEPPDLVEIRENGLRFLVDVKRGHKTGFYLDQRDNRRKVAPYLRGREVLNCFAYTGAFAVYALAAGAKSVVNVDTSADSLELARKNLDLTGLGDLSGLEYVTGDVFAELRRFRAEGRTFDAIILDPPKFAQSEGQLKRAARGYQDINRVAMNILRPDGTLVTFSCSGLVTPNLFQKIVFSASLEAERDVQIVEKLGQSSDHPILATLPESEYLKGFICRVW
jgi:23S rRNA (cytosine1962-C5)-methyltransferase